MRKATKDKKITKCACGCNKDIKKRLSYYRDGNYFATKSHWKRAKQKNETES